MTDWNAISPVNWVAELFHNQCSPRPIIYIELAAMAYLQAFSSVVTPDIKEDIKLATGKSWLKHGKGALKNADGPHPPLLKKAGALIVGAGEAVDKTVWWLFLAGVLNGTASAYATAAYYTEPCAQPGALHWARSSTPLGFYDGWDDWNIGPGWFAVSGTDGPALSSMIAFPAGCSFWVYCGWRCEAFLGLGKVTSMTLICKDEADNFVDVVDWNADESDGEDTPFVFHYEPKIKHGRVMSFWFRATTDGFVLELSAYSGACGYEYWTPGTSKPEPMHLLAPKRLNPEKWMLGQASDFVKKQASNIF